MVETNGFFCIQILPIWFILRHDHLVIIHELNYELKFVSFFNNENSFIWFSNAKCSTFLIVISLFLLFLSHFCFKPVPFFLWWFSLPDNRNLRILDCIHLNRDYVRKKLILTHQWINKNWKQVRCTDNSNTYVCYIDKINK